MRVRYERPLSDLSFLISAPLRLDVGAGRAATITRWSLEGFEPPRGLDGSEGEARITLPFNGFEITFTVQLHRDTERDFMRFVELGEREQRILRHFYREIVTGRAEPVDQMICAMDIPTEPVPMQRTPQETKAAPRPGLPRPVRAAAIVGFYAMLGVALYGPILSPVWDRMSLLTEHPAARPAVAPQPAPAVWVDAPVMNQQEVAARTLPDRPDR